MRKLLICALALGGFAASAQAADIGGGSLKEPGADNVMGLGDPIPDNLTVAGITLYGTIDVGYGYLTESAPTSNNMYWSEPYIIQKYSRGTNNSAWTDNALEQSKVGLKMEESLGNGFVLIGKAETNFNPLSMQLSDACAALTENNGKTNPATMVSASNGSRCGQPFAGQYFAGLSNASYGTLTGGRQSSLQNDTVGAYDVMGGAYAFSLLSSGTVDGGAGTSEAARWDNAIKYVYQYGPLHAAGMYSFGDQGTAIFGQAYGANVGGTYKGFSLDAVYTKQEGGAAAASLGASWTGSNDLKATVTNNEAWSIQAKYVMELGGGFKDEAPGGKVTFSGGYVYMDLSNPDHLQNYYNNMQTAGWYRLAGMTSPVNAFGSDKVLETVFAGAKYETGPWTFAGAYYRLHQDEYLNASLKNCAAGTKAPSGNILTPSNCAGDEDVGSFLVGYKFDKHFDVYSGVSYSDIGGGLASGFLNSNNTTFASGLRIRF